MVAAVNFPLRDVHILSFTPVLQYQVKRLTEKNVSEITLFCVAFDVNLSPISHSPPDNSMQTK